MNLAMPNIRERIDNVLGIPIAVNDTPILDMPPLSQTPINERTPGFISLAFPCLFPYGNIFNI